MESDPRLHPAGAILVKKDADMLRFKLFVRGHKAKDLDHSAKRI